MLYDAYDRPIRRPSGLQTPAWLQEQIIKLLRDDLKKAQTLSTQLRVLKLRESVLCS